MKSAILLTLLLWQATVSPQPTDQHYLRYQRTIAIPAGAGQSCAIVDPALFPHAGPSLKDLRLFQGNREIPYAITLSEPNSLTAIQPSFATLVSAAATSSSTSRCRTALTPNSPSTSQDMTS
jgi:hypothetical protein